MEKPATSRSKKKIYVAGETGVDVHSAKEKKSIHHQGAYFLTNRGVKGAYLSSPAQKKKKREKPYPNGGGKSKQHLLKHSLYKGKSASPLREKEKRFVPEWPGKPPREEAADHARRK